jgi:hypothetical protein
VRISKLTAVLAFVSLWLVTMAGALTFELTDGTKLEGDITLIKPTTLQIRTNDSAMAYIELEIGKLSQATLTELKQFATSKNNKKLLDNIEPYIEIPLDEKIKKTEVVIKEVPRVPRPAKSSVIGGLFSSSVGIFCLLLLYAANVYAGYEIALIRAYPPALVCGIAAIAPVIGPIIFLSMPTKMPASEEEQVAETQIPGEHSASYGAPAAPHTSSHQEASAESMPVAQALPQTQVFKRGQFTFNRRFIETKFAPFFAIDRKEADRDLDLIIKSVRGEFLVTRIADIGASDMRVDASSGGANQQTQIAFAEIQEMQIKHKNA